MRSWGLGDKHAHVEQFDWTVLDSSNVFPLGMCSPFLACEHYPCAYVYMCVCVIPTSYTTNVSAYVLIVSFDYVVQGRCNTYVG